MGLLRQLTVTTLLLISFSFSQKEKAEQFLKDYEAKFAPMWREEYEVRWKLATNITEYNAMVQNEVIQRLEEEEAIWREKAAEINTQDSDDNTKRQFKILLTAITYPNKTLLKNATETSTAMRSAYNTGTIPYNSTFIKKIKPIQGTLTELRLGRHLLYIMAVSDDPDELLYVWKTWRDVVGAKTKDYFTEYVKLRNIGAKESGFEDAGEYRRAPYEVHNLEEIADNFLSGMRDFYEELHAYVRFCLSMVYPEHITPRGPIPAHLLGNMWAQNWAHIYRHVVPFPDELPLDVTPAIQNLTVNEMFKKAEDFFTSLGWRELPAKFWTHSLFVEPHDRDVECHASAWDFTMPDNGEPDVRVKMCTRKTQGHFTTIHHELGHTYYQMFYWNQPIIYRTGTNPGFHEAVGDTMALSVQTPSHLKKVGLLEEVSTTTESELNFLLKTALRRIAFLPFAFVMDKWVWDVYSGDISPDQYNAKWWEYRMKYQGVKSPVKREDDGFDPGGKAHITGDTPYIRYFFSYILQFAFHKQACKLANHTGPLHHCSIYQSKEAGKALREMLELGKSKPWPEVLEQYTGSKEISTEPIREYFTPLMDYLKAYRQENGYTLGWE